MGICLGLTFDKKFPGGDSFAGFTDGKDLVRAMDRLDELCEREQVTPFSAFAPDYDALAEELSEGETLDTLWFDPADGLRTVSALVRVAGSEPRWAKGLTKAEARVVAECLGELERLLRIGRRRKARFYFLYY